MLAYDGNIFLHIEQDFSAPRLCLSATAANSGGLFRDGGCRSSVVVGSRTHISNGNVGGGDDEDSEDDPPAAD